MYHEVRITDDLPIDELGVGSWIWTIDGGVRWSRALAEIHRLRDRTIATFEEFLATIHVDDVAAVVDAIDDALAQRGAYRVTYRFHRDDGTIGWLRGVGKVITDDAGEPVGMNGLGLEITEERMALADLEQRQAEVTRLLAERDEVHRMLQASIVPRPFQDRPWLRTSSAFAPAGVEATGDFFALHHLSPTRTVVAIGDVAGHGPGAGILSATLQHALLAVAGTGGGPGRMLASLNRVLIDILQGDFRFATAHLVLLEDAGPLVRARFATAGHEAFLLRAAGAVTPVGSEGPALGVLPDPTFREVVVELAPGDVLAACTDGVHEARDSNREPFGLARFHHAVATFPDPLPQDAASVVVDAVVDHVGPDRPLPDDAAVIALQVVEPDERQEMPT